MAKKQANTFSIEAFKLSKPNDIRTMSLRYVHHPVTVGKWLEKQKIEWYYMNVYDRKTSKFLYRVYRHEMSL